MACRLTRHFVTVKGVSIQKSLFNIFDIRKRKPESDTDLRYDTQVKKRKFCPKVQSLSRAYGCQPKPSKSFVHGANNFQRSSLTRHHSGNDHIVAMNNIKQKEDLSRPLCVMFKRSQAQH